MRRLVPILLFLATVVTTLGAGALMAGADPFVRETWIGFAILFVKSVVSASISYFMRLKTTPNAVTWAATQPRYEMTSTTEQKSSTVLP